MRRRIRIWVFGVGDIKGAGSQLRFFSPYRYFAAERFEFFPVPSFKAISGLFSLPDLIIFNRSAYPAREVKNIIRFASASGIPTLLDIDDLLIDLPPEHIRYRAYERIKTDLIGIIRSVDHISVSTLELKNRLIDLNPNIKILPNLIDEKIWRVPAKAEHKPPASPVCIGYSGFITHGYDFKPVIPAIKRLLAEYRSKVCFKFIGYIPPELRGVPEVEFQPGNEAYTDFAGILNNSAFDLAIAPLTDNSFNRCKSNIKFLEYSVCGFPAVYSDVGPYHSSVTQGETGLLAQNTPEDWFNKIEALIKDPELRSHIAGNARVEVLSEYSLESKFTLWQDYYDSILSHRQAGKKNFMINSLAAYGPYVIYNELCKLSGVIRRGFHG